MKKKILFMLCTWQEAYSQTILKGIENAIENIDIEIHVINAYGSAVEYFTKEVEAFLLVDVRDYDGVMLMLNGVGSYDYLEKYAKECIEYDIPAVSIDIPFPGIAYCGIDNYLSAYKITEHLIKEHNVSKLHYIGGPEDHPDSIERSKAFIDCLKDNGLEPYGFSYYGFMRSSGRKAYEDIKASGKPMAEAYVFSNDFSALGFCMAAKEDGLVPPADFLAVGFDNQPDARNYFPSISSIDRNLEGLGYNSILHLINIIDGKTPVDADRTIPGVLVRGGTCGCEKNRDLAGQYLELNAKFMMRNEYDSLQKSARERLCGNENFEQFQEELRSCMSKWGIEDFRIGVNRFIFDASNNITEGYDDVMNVYGADSFSLIYRKEGLIPDDFRDDKTKIYWFGTLHCKEKTLGYSIFKYNSALMEFQYHRTLNETASMAVENIKQSVILSEVNQKLERLYITDSLTGLYNRFGYNSFAQKLYEENKGRIYIVFIDMDNLKVMNDSYGHKYGDIALKGISEAMKAVYTDTDVKVRVGGDEFLVIGPFVSEDELFMKERRISDYLLRYTERMCLPINVEVSIGHAFSESGYDDDSGLNLEAILQNADSRMYIEKQTKKKK
ncbi:MAG: GGDEF domain-containing protein [Lachnospiraceae bacterium]|nr:GGDEF domain-containing protein [Lachnospiraceae bacterium]